jgi:hypothetical protein
VELYLHHPIVLPLPTERKKSRMERWIRRIRK